ncbi:myosin light chain kinase, smooth muscle isoform X3 [Oryzias latipes]|nr:myosin light chain kinase, smooth muscle isoform X3 [Oryzias latipes]XP_020560808.1 myosin light chain kinase, smooth muscle isoform X3 [Oryzias latipes]
MNGDGSQKLFVSTFRMHIKPPNALSAQTSRLRIIDSRTPVKCSETEFRLKSLEPPVFIQPLEDCCVDEGSDIVVRGVVKGSQPITVMWLHNGEAAHFGKACFDGREVKFVVRECLPEDAGAYTCLVENSAGKKSCSAAVCVRDFETKFSGLKFPISPSKSIEANGKSSPTRNELQKFKGSTCSSPVSPDRQSPVSSPRVIPKKRANSATGPVLHFTNPPQHLEVKAGQTAKLSCSFRGSPPVASCWIRNKEEQVVDGTDLWTENTDESTTLVIANAEPQHTGRYTVVLKDRKSSAQHTLTLAVIERPEPPASCPVVSLLSESSLVLSWSGPCYDGGSAIVGYVVEVNNQGCAENWVELTDQCESTSYIVCAGLQPNHEYCFRVRAFNPAGVSEPSPVSSAVRMEQKDCEKPDDPSPEYTLVTIDSTHKVTDHYILQEKLGMGKFGLVFKLTHKETGHVCAGKFYKGRRAAEREAARREIELMNHLHHPKLVQCLAAYDHKPEMVMVMEFIPGGELFERIVDDNFEHTELASVRYMQQILEGVAYIHQQKIVHLDLKPENIVCVDTNGHSIKIIDFGLASKIDDKTPLKVMHGTPEFVAPEVINYEPVHLATDMWSVGVICYILLSGESPFQGESDAETLALVTSAQWEFDEESFSDITEEAKHFISSLLVKVPRRRMSCEEALAHPWIAAFDSGDLTSTKSLSKEKMKRFLARQKWKKAGKAMLALKRMTLLSKSDSCVSPTTPGEVSLMSPEAKCALQSLELKMQGPPVFTQKLEDQTVTQGSSARLSCNLTGYPDPEVVWLCGDEPLEESSAVQIEYDEDGCCALILTDVCMQDTNVYTCRATNDHGETYCSAKLTVQK